jgi:hypothetical protein
VDDIDGRNGTIRSKNQVPPEKKTEDVQSEKMIPIIPLLPYEQSPARLPLQGSSMAMRMKAYAIMLNMISSRRVGIIRIGA